MSDSSKETQNIDEPNSVIQLLLDQFGIKRSILSIFKNSKINFTSKLFDSLVLFIVFFLVFYESNLIVARFTTPMLILIALVLFTVVELIGANFPYFKKYFSNDEKSKIFLENVEKMSSKEMHNFIKFHIFSPKYIDIILDTVKIDKNKIPPNIVEYVLTTQDLTKKNIDNIFSDEVLPNINKNIVIDILFKQRDQLTEKNVIAIYKAYQRDFELVKILFATQETSNCLIKQFPEESKFSDCYIKLYENKEYLKGWIKHISFNGYKIIIGFIHLCLFVVIFLLLVFLFAMFYTEYPSTLLNSHQIVANIIFIPFILVFILEIFVLKYFFSRIKSRYFMVLKSHINTFSVNKIL